MGLLMLLGLIVMYAIGPQRAQVMNSAYGSDYDGIYFFAKQAFSLAMAFTAFVIVSKIPISWWKTNAKKLFITGIAASAILAIGGWAGASFVQCSLGACRWFDLGPLGSIQPAEFLKFGLLLFGAGFLAYRAKQGVLNDMYKTVLPFGGILGVVAVFVIWSQQDMGTGLVMLIMLSSMLLISGIKLRVAAGMLAGLVALGVLLIITAPHRIARITTFFQGDAAGVDDAGAYHIAHALIAIGSGGPTGVGIGNSVQATGYLPEAINDSVFAIMGETFGFVGLVLVLILFGALLLGLLKVASQLPDLHEKLIVVGVFGWLAAHVILNVAAMTGVFPLTGITLPLLSFGGTSMVFIAGALGLAFRLSSYTVHTSVSEGERYEDSHGRRGLGRPRHASRSRM
ncbi:MAG: FtsW/RodA/SpoVE family cell cycle protein [Patescibacteria group bacterium]